MNFKKHFFTAIFIFFTFSGLAQVKFGLHANYELQQVGILKHNVLTQTKSFFANGISFGIQLRIGKSITAGAGLNFMGNDNHSPSNMNGFAEARAGDSLKIIPTDNPAPISRTDVYAPYLFACYKIPLKDRFTFEPLLRVSFHQVYVTDTKSYLLVSRKSNYNEIVSYFGYEILSLSFQPSLGMGFKITENTKLVANASYVIHTLQPKILNYDPELLTITIANNENPIKQEFNRPQVKNGIGGSVGFRIFF